MKRRYLMAAGVGMAISLTVVLASLPAVAGNGANGNGAPSGSPPQPEHHRGRQGQVRRNDGSSGKSLFVNLWGSCKIDLMEGAFDVGDRNCTDDGEALFYLPDPDDGDGKLAYSVWVRVPRPGATRT